MFYEVQISDWETARDRAEATVTENTGKVFHTFGCGEG